MQSKSYPGIFGSALGRLLVCSVAFALTGCGAHSFISTATLPVTGQAMQGSVHGGQQPVAGAAIQLYAANSTTYAGNAYALLTTSVTTGASGGFSITGDYTCPSASSLVYLVATGGNPGGTSVNPNLAMMAALGSCGNLSASTFINVNELTTVASAYALAPFMNSMTTAGTSVGNAQGLANAFATVNSLVNTTTGALSGPTLPVNAVLPTAELNTLGDILAACINSNGGTAGDGSPCGQLFSYTTVGGTAPTDTIAAVLSIAHHPANNAMNLVALATPASPFQPTLSSASDFTVAVKYKTGGFSTPSSSALDASGNLWVTNSSNDTLTVLSPTGSPMPGSPFSGGGLSKPSSIAIDSSGNAWIADRGSSMLSVFTPAGTGTLTSATNLSAPSGIAIDGQGILWITNSKSNSVTSVTVSGTTVTSSQGYNQGGPNQPVAVAINPN
jgi:hypothetical protein